MAWVFYMLFYIPASYMLWLIMNWDLKSRSLISWTVLLITSMFLLVSPVLFAIMYIVLS